MFDVDNASVILQLSSLSIIQRYFCSRNVHGSKKELTNLTIKQREVIIMEAKKRIRNVHDGVLRVLRRR